MPNTSVNIQKIASFDVDAQNCFTPRCPDELPVAEGDQIVAELNAQASWARFRIGSKDAHSPQAIWVANAEHPPLSPLSATNADCYWPKHAVPGTFGFELLAGLPAVTAYDYFVWKGVEPDLHPYGACYHDLAEKQSTGVIEYLQAKQISHVIVGGLASDYCVKHTVLQLLKAGLQVWVNQAACRGVAPATTEAAWLAVQQAGAQIIKNTAQLAEWVRR